MLLHPEVQELIRGARGRAAAAKHPKVTVYHLLASLLENLALQAVIQQAGGSLQELTALTATHLEQVEMPSIWDRLVSAVVSRSGSVEDASFRGAIRVASVQVLLGSRKEVGVVDVFVALFRLRDSELTDILTRSNVSRLAILRFHCHGLRPLQVGADVTTGDRCEVVVFNDDYTEMVLVVRIFQEAFDMSPTQAYRSMIRVHEEGSVVLGPYPGEVAVRRMQSATEMAAAGEVPLRLELRAASD
jgi:ATP-dependent Clp protease adaptor protein ClpS